MRHSLGITDIVFKIAEEIYKVWCRMAWLRCLKYPVEKERIVSEKKETEEFC